MAMQGQDVSTARKRRGMRQVELAKLLNVSQGYVSLLERNRRPVPRALASRLASVLDLSPSKLPVGQSATPLDAEQAARALARLGYSGFAYLRPNRALNPAEFVLRTLRSPSVDARVVEALPWVLWKFPDLDWAWLVSQVKVADLQNRLGLLVTLARQLAERHDDAEAAAKLSVRERELEGSRLQREDGFKQSLTDAERRWLRVHRPAEAAHWNMLTNLTASALADAQ
jgi:transcriptional regulator with XRE-family HTH domain